MPRDLSSLSRPGSERAILSIITNDPDKIFECERLNLFAEHFFVPAHQYLYSAVAYLVQQNVNRIDSLLLYNVITDPNAKEAVDEIGGMEYIDAIIQSRVIDNLNIYVNQVRNCAIKRLAYKFGEEVQASVFDSGIDEPVSDLLGKIQEMTLNLVLENEEETEVYLMGSETEDILRQRAANPCIIPGYSMGWERYDRITQGHKGNELTVFIARSKTGKSAMLLNHAHKFSIVDGMPCMYFDTEMTDREQEDRLLAIDSGVPYEEIVNGMFARDTQHGQAQVKINKLYESLNRIRNAQLYHVYIPSFTIEKITALARKYHIQHNLAVIFFDYIKLPNSEVNNLQTAQEYQRLGYITTCLKDLAGICDIPVITAAQANRSGSGEDMDENDVGGSYRIIQMATRVVFMRNKTEQEILNEGFERGNLKVKIGFQRNGASNSQYIDFMFDHPTLRIKEIV